jgi:Holliday junction resolvase
MATAIKKKKLSQKAVPGWKKPTFETVWETLQEVSASLKETERIVKRNGKQMGELHRRFGQLAEHLVAPGIAKRFNELGYKFSAMAPKGQKIFDAKTGKIKTEIDLILENGKTIMAVEVKTRLVIQDVEHHIRRLEILSDHRRGINDQRKVQGAIAGAIYEDDVKKAVSEAGFYVIEQSGDTMKIDMPDGFIPREW